MSDPLLSPSDQLDLMNLSTRAVVMRLVKHYLIRYKKKIAISMIALIVVALTTSMLPLLIQSVTDDIFIGHDEKALIYLPLIIAGIMLVKGLSEYFAAVNDAYVVNRVIADIRIDMFQALTNADMRWLRGVHSGRVQSSFLSDTNIIRDSAAKIIVALGKNLLKLIVLTANMIYLNWVLSAVILAFLPFVGIILTKQRQKMRLESRKTMKKTADTASLLSEAMKAIPIIKAYRKEKEELSRISQDIEAAFFHYWNVVRIRASASPLTEAIVGIGLAIAIFVAGYQGINGDLTAGEFTGFLTAVVLLIQPLRAVANLHTSIQEGVAAANRVFSILDEMPQISSKANAAALNVTKGDVTFQNIDFVYESSQSLFEGLNLHFKAGERTALVGASGAGKTTIFYLLLRFYDPLKGQILIDGHDISHYDIASLRQNCALVTQSPILFDMSIRDNICYGIDNVDEKELEAILDSVALKDFVNSLPNGIDSFIGEGGELLSGGQKQRLTLARALIMKAPILLLEEPTSALDNITESVIQNSLEKLHGNTTVIIIAHRLSTIANADNIMVLEGGKLVEEGKHDALLSHEGRYAKMFNV